MSDSNVTAQERSPSARLRDRIAMVLMLVLSAWSLVVAVEALTTLSAVSPDTRAVEVWRTLGYVLFAGLYALVAFLPRQTPGVWELLLFHKLGQVVLLAPYAGTDGDRSPFEQIGTIILNDLLLVVVTLAAYVLARGWRAWWVTLRPGSATA